MSSTETMLAARWHPPSFDIRVESVPIPQIQDPDDAIVKVTLAGLCGSDLHVYRGEIAVPKIHISGHEFIGEIIQLGSNYGPNAPSTQTSTETSSQTSSTETSTETSPRPALYSTLKLADKVVAPFSVSCGACAPCRTGYTSRCLSSLLFGSPRLDGGQAQYVRVPKAGGMLYNLSDAASWVGVHTGGGGGGGNDVEVGEGEVGEGEVDVGKLLRGINDSSLLLLSDILPTGVFGAKQLLGHPKMQPALTGIAWPACLSPPSTSLTNTQTATPALTPLTPSDRLITLALIGLGPVGVCASIALLDELARRGLPYKIVAIDLNEGRREKMRRIYEVIGADGKGGDGEFVVAGPEEAKEVVRRWTAGVGCNAVLEVVGHNSALTTAYELVRAFGVITSVGVHAPKSLPFTGQQLYDKNISLDFGRCPARAMIPDAFRLLVKRQDVFGGVGTETSLIDRVTGIGEATEMYRAFEKGQIGKVLFDPWK